MAPSFANVKIVSAFLTNQISAAATRRGYAAQGGALKGLSGGVVAPNMLLKKAGDESSKTRSWVPDPVTGYYRPENQAGEIDAVELRALLLKNKIRAN